MAQCLVVDPGTGAVLASAAEPCTGFVALTPAEFAVFSANPFLLSPEQGVLISSAVVGVWAAAWCWKALARALNDDGDRSSS